QVRHIKRVGLDEVAARLHIVTHQAGEDLVGSDGILDGDTQHATDIRVHGGFPQLFRVHLTKTLVALDIGALARLDHKPREGVIELLHRLARLVTLDGGVGGQQAFEFFTQGLDAGIVRRAEEIGRYLVVAAYAVSKYLHTWQ